MLVQPRACEAKEANVVIEAIEAIERKARSVAVVMPLCSHSDPRDSP